jgi:hypothetical protein
MSRWVNPVLMHSGDLCSVAYRDFPRAESYMDVWQAAGYHGVRGGWTVLMVQPHWRGREFGPWLQGYRDTIARVQDALDQRGLMWFVSQGDLWHLDAAGRAAVREAQLATLSRQTVIGMDGANEPVNNGNASPDAIRAWLRPFLERWPDLIYALGAPVGEEKAGLDAYAGRIYSVHGFRLDRWWDKIRHIFSIPWEIKPARRLGHQAEPFGPGPYVSGVANKHELTAGVMQAACVQSLMCRQAWTFFAGCEREEARFEDQPGFWETPKIAQFVPKDVMTWELTHGGESQAGKQWFACTDDHPGGPKTMRVDQAIAPDGRAIALAYGPNLRDHEQTRGTVEQRIDLEDKAILYLGRAA